MTTDAADANPYRVYGADVTGSVRASCGCPAATGNPFDAVTPGPPTNTVDAAVTVARVTVDPGDSTASGVAVVALQVTWDSDSAI
jgi:hypothetical protein